MAVVRTRSTPPYGLFAAVALAVIATGAAVVFYLMWAKTTDDLKNANELAAKVGTNVDASAYKTAAGDANKTGTYLSLATKQIAALRDELQTAKNSLASVTT